MKQDKQRDEPAYLVFDVETIPDGELIRRVKYAHEDMSTDEAVQRAREEALEKSEGHSDFLAPSFCYPIAICVARVAADFTLQSITCLDTPKFRSREMVADFWKGMAHYHATLVSFNGRGFDLPVLELAAFRFGISARGHFDDRFGRRYRFGTAHLDLNDWLSNHGACPITGGL
ncbi:MAG: 3'-5' exonuclease, partial [Planctomycetota bacterium]